MNKNELINHIANECNVPKSAVNDMLNSFCNAVVNEVSGGGEVKLVGFGRFYRTARSERLVPDNDGGMAVIPAHDAPVFSPSEAFKKSVDPNRGIKIVAKPKKEDKKGKHKNTDKTVKEETPKRGRGRPKKNK